MICQQFFPSCCSDSCSLTLLTAPAVSASFSFGLVQVTEHQTELRWGNLSSLNSLNLSSFEIFLQYQEEENEGCYQAEEDRSKKLEDANRAQIQSGPKKIVQVPISLYSRGVTVAGLSPGSIYLFTLKAAHPAGFTWNLGQTQTAYTSESVDNLSHS